MRDHRLFIKKNFVNSSDAITHNKPVRSIDFLKEKETKILRGEHAVLQMLDEIVLNCKNYFFEYGEKSALIVIYKIPEYSEFYKRLRTNGVKIKFLTDMTKENIRQCKQFVKDFGAEMKHLEGLRGSFAVTEQIYISTNTFEAKRPVVELITSNVHHVVKQNQFIFDILWKKATPAKQRIREIEEGMLPVETRIVDNPGEIFALILDITKKNNNGLSNCSTIGGFKMIYENKKLFQSYSNLLSRYKERKVKGGGGRGDSDGGGIRWITHIENKKEQVDLINKFLNIGIQIRHANNLPPISFALSDKQFQGTIEKMEHGKMFKNVLYSTEPLYIKHFQSIFEELWKTGIDAQERINQIEKGLGSVITKVIENPNQTKFQLERMLEDAKEEILIIFPTLNTLQRYENAGLVNILIDKSHIGVKIKILSPVDKYTHRTILEKKESSDDKTKNIIIRGIVNQQDIRSTIVMIDKKSVLTIE
ncbi:MAG TPA: hypothetical protein VFT71_04305, partial [Candidatus Nitrosocosmicus sp.]|nr:hypothetical protein [Candidatus Nitrosocosmicus sp.]